MGPKTNFSLLCTVYGNKTLWLKWHNFFRGNTVLYSCQLSTSLHLDHSKCLCFCLCFVASSVSVALCVLCLFLWLHMYLWTSTLANYCHSSSPGWPSLWLCTYSWRLLGQQHWQLHLRKGSINTQHTHTYTGRLQASVTGCLIASQELIIKLEKSWHHQSCVCG